jgi:hypothetical protein
MDQQAPPTNNTTNTCPPAAAIPPQQQHQQPVQPVQATIPTNPAATQPASQPTHPFAGAKDANYLPPKE